MNDEIRPETTTRKGGWPKGKPRPKAKRPDWDSDGFDKKPEPSPMLAKMKARPNWESSDFAGPGAGLEGVDRLHIPPEIIDSLWRDGIALQFITKAVRGMETPQELTQMTRGGWTPVHQSDFDGVLDGRLMSKGVDEIITVGDCMLVARPAEMQKKAKSQERTEATEQTKRAERELLENGVRASGGRHITVRNQINKSLERIEIPEE